VFFICWWTTGEVYSRSKRTRALPLPTSAAKSTAENKQKGNHAREVFFAAFGAFCGGSTAPLTGPA